MVDERIIERIKKVLELSLNNPSQEEAQAAALKAQELMAQYHVTMKELDGVLEEPITEFDIEVGAGKKWKYSLAVVVARNYACKLFTRGSENIVFYGYESDVLIAGNVFNMLFYVGNEGARKEVKKYRDVGYSVNGLFNTYVAGFVAGVSHELDKQCTALQIVVSSEVEKSYTDYTSSMNMRRRNTSLSYRRNESVYNNGFSAGRSAMNARDLEAV